MVGFNAPPQARELPAPDSMPLLQTGPGGEYGRAYYGRERRLMATAPLPNLRRPARCNSASLVMASTTWLGRLLGLVHGSRTRPRGRTSDLQRLATTSRSNCSLQAATTPLIEYFEDRAHDQRPTLHTTRVIYNAPESHNESHAEATLRTPADPRIETRAGLFPDDAGARRRTRRQQSHGLRTRAGARAKRNRKAGTKQGTLFVNL